MSYETKIPNPKRRFRNRAVLRMRAAGMTQVEVAQATGLSFQRVGQIERRHRQGVRHYRTEDLGPEPVSPDEAIALAPYAGVLAALKEF